MNGWEFKSNTLSKWRRNTSVTNDTDWDNLADNNTDDAYCFYNNNNANATDYGALYTYAATISDNWERDNADDQGVCPDGWHLPTDAEWTTLIDFLGGTDIAGGKMKEIGTTHWNSPNTSADNSSGFSAFPGGGHFSNGDFYQLGAYSAWWSATEYDSRHVYGHDVGYNSAEVEHFSNQKAIGFSVRCIRD